MDEQVRDVINFYVDIIDDQEANEILRIFKEKVPGFSKKNPDLHIKKRYINQIFRKQTPETKKAKRDPFSFYIEKFSSLQENLSLSTTEFMQYFYELRFQNDANYIKFIRLYINFPQNISNVLPILKEQHKKDEELFKLDFHIENLNEYIEFMKKTHMYIRKNKIQNFLSFAIDECIPDQTIAQSKKVESNIKDLDILELNKRHAELKEEYSETAISYAYLKNNYKTLDQDIAVGLSMDLAHGLLMDYKYHIINLQDSVKSTKEHLKVIEEAEDKFEKIKQEIDKAGYTVNELKSVKNILEKENRDLKKKITSLDKDITKMKNDCTSQLTQVSKEKQNLEKEASKIQNEKDELQLQIHELSKTEEDIKQAKFCIVHSFESNLLKGLFPEIPIYKISEIHKINNSILSLNVSTIYVQSEGICTDDFIDINSIALKNNKSCSLFEAPSLKNIIEKIGYYKTIHNNT